MKRNLLPVHLNLKVERWVMLIMAGLPLLGMNFSQFSLSSFPEELIEVFHITNTQLSAVTLVYFLALGSIGAVGGLLADKFGMRRVMIIAAAITVVSAVLRLFITDYYVFFILSFLSGALSGVGFAVSGKIIRMWFPERLSVVAFGIVAICGALGTSLPQFASGIMHSYSQGILIGGILLAITGILWVLFGKDAPDGYEKGPVLPFFRYFGKVVKVRQVWIISFALICFASELLGATVLLPRLLVMERGLETAQANGITGFLNIAAVIGTILIPQLQARIGKTKQIIIIMSILEIVNLVLLMVVGNGILWLIVFTFGLSISCIDSFLMSLLSGTKSIGSEYMGTASGFVSMLRFVIGGFAIPTFIVTPLVDISPVYLLISIGVFVVIQIVMTLIIRTD